MTAATAPRKIVMRDSIRQFFPTGRTLATLLTHVSRGMAADALLRELDEQIEEAAIIQLPQFAIRDFDGAESVNRIQWEGDSGRATRLVEYGQTLTIRWRVQDSTLPELTGTLTATLGAAGTEISGDLPPIDGAHIAGNLHGRAGADAASPITPTITHAHTRTELQRRLGRISEHGKAQTFALATLLHPYGQHAVERASMRVYREIHGLDSEDASGHIIDEIERESVLNTLMLGDRKTDSVVIRLIRRVAATDATVCKSVLVVVATAIWSGAETQVRRHIGDPHLGRVIRRLARQLGNLTGIVEVDADNVLEAYKQEYPEQRVGIERVIDALTAGATLGSQTVAYDVHGSFGGAD